MRETHNRGFKGVWIPKEIWLANDLGWSEKLLLVEIESLDGEQGCWASNEYLATFFSLSKGRISKLISSLKDKGYVTVDLIYKPGTKVIDRRIIKTTRGYGWKRLGGMVESVATLIDVNSQENNTVFNNTLNNKRNNCSQSSGFHFNPNFNFIKQLFESNVRIATLADCNNIHEALKFYDPLLIQEAIYAGTHSAQSFKYILSILDNWRKELGVKTYADWQVKIDAKIGRQNGSSNGGATSTKPTVFGNYCSD